MLLRFEVSNHRSIMEPVELSMIAVDKDRPAARAFELLSEHVLTVAGIYGPNASGKSNVIDSIRWLSAATRSSLNDWVEFIPRQPFKFAAGPTSPTSFEVEMMVGGVRYTYKLMLNDVEVIFEGLYSYPERRRRSLFERDRGQLHLRRGLGHLSGARELLTPTTLALSAAARFDQAEVRGFWRAVASIGLVGERPPFRRRDRLMRLLTPGPSTADLFLGNHRSAQLSLFGEDSEESARGQSREGSGAPALCRFGN